MNTMIKGHILKRTLFIDFNLYVEDDAEFKEQLVELMIENLQELRETYRIAVEQKDLASFLKACHKVKTTMVMLDDKELNDLVDEIKIMDPDVIRFSLLNKLCGEIIASLSSEK
jgi:hypothetical protein